MTSQLNALQCIAIERRGEGQFTRVGRALHFRRGAELHRFYFPSDKGAEMALRVYRRAPDAALEAAGASA